MISPWNEASGYAQLADLLRADIQSGRIAAGQALPSEMTLSKTYDMSIKTVRAAVAQLRVEGLVYVRRGYGVVVRKPPELEVIVVPAGSQVGARTPTPQERAQYEVPEGWPLLVVWLPDGLIDSYSADRYRIEIEPGPAPE